jgi:hypothetical protein
MNNSFVCDIVSNGIISKKNRILVIGDLHADFRKTKKIFIDLKLIDINNNWVAKPKNTVVVQIGDQLDGGGRGYSEASGELELINFMDMVHRKAHQKDGGVYSLIGNHEIMNLLGNFTYSSEKDIESQGGIEIREKLFSPGGLIFNRMSCTRNVVLKVGDFIFAHAGVLPEHIEGYDKNVFIKKVNTLMRLFLQGKKTVEDKEIGRLFLNKKGIIWDRNYGSKNPRCENIEEISKLLNVGHMIVGHTVQKGINSRCDNKLWRVDVGISDSFSGNKIEVLEILDNGVPTEKNKKKPFRIIKI